MCAAETARDGEAVRQQCDFFFFFCCFCHFLHWDLVDFSKGALQWQWRQRQHRLSSPFPCVHKHSCIYCRFFSIKSYRRSLLLTLTFLLSYFSPGWRQAYKKGEGREKERQEHTPYNTYKHWQITRKKEGMCFIGRKLNSLKCKSVFAPVYSELENSAIEKCACVQRCLCSQLPPIKLTDTLSGGKEHISRKHKVKCGRKRQGSFHHHYLNQYFFCRQTCSELAAASEKLSICSDPLCMCAIDCQLLLAALW